MIEPAAAAKTPLLEMDLEVRELHVNGAGKRPLWSKKWTILGILSVVEILRQLALASDGIGREEAKQMLEHRTIDEYDQWRNWRGVRVGQPR